MTVQHTSQEVKRQKIMQETKAKRFHNQQVAPNES